MIIWDLCSPSVRRSSAGRGLVGRSSGMKQSNRRNGFWIRCHQAASSVESGVGASRTLPEWAMADSQAGD